MGVKSPNVHATVSLLLTSIESWFREISACSMLAPAAPSALSARESLEGKNGFLNLFVLRAQMLKHLDDIYLGSESFRVPVELARWTSDES